MAVLTATASMPGTVVKAGHPGVDGDLDA